VFGTRYKAAKKEKNEKEKEKRAGLHENH